MIKAVFIDIDGTLKNSKKEISKKTQSEIERCIQKGIKIILTSGRSRKETIEYQEQLKTSPYIISSNGASCYDIERKKEIYNIPLKKQIAQQLLEYANKNNYNIKFNYKDKLVLNKAAYPDEKDKEVRTTVMMDKQELQEYIERLNDYYEVSYYEVARLDEPKKDYQKKYLTIDETNDNGEKLFKLVELITDDKKYPQKKANRIVGAIRVKE